MRPDGRNADERGCPFVEPEKTSAAAGGAALRLAVAGKGGSGKTTIAGTLARLLARRGRPVLAVDGDTNPNLAQTLGVPPESMPELTALPGDLLRRREEPDGTARMELAVPASEVLARYGRALPEGIRLLVMGRVDHAGAG